jgi:hypothetical protein
MSEPTPRSVREEVLLSALEIVTKDRNINYGSPEQNFQVIADLWSTYFNARSTLPRIEFQTHDVAVLLILLKVARTVTSPDRLDHWVDIAGYAACGMEAQSAQ